MRAPFGEVSYAAGRLLGAAAGTGNTLAWIYAIWIPGAGLSLSGVNVAVALLMSLFSILAVIASWRGHAVILFVMFLASFLPVGAVLLRADHWLRWVGILDLCLLAAAALIRVGGHTRLSRDAR